MTIFFNAIQTLKQFAYPIFLPQKMAKLLRLFNGSASDEIEYAIVHAFILSIISKRYPLYKKIPSFLAFEHDIQEIIQNNYTYKKSMLEDESFCDVDQEKTQSHLLCATYILIGLNLYHPTNQITLTNHQMVHLLARNMHMLFKADLLNQSTFEFLTHESSNTKDMTLLLIALKSSHHIDLYHINDIVEHYMPQLGQILYYLARANQNNKHSKKVLTQEGRRFVISCFEKPLARKEKPPTTVKYEQVRGALRTNVTKTITPSKKYEQKSASVTKLSVIQTLLWRDFSHSEIISTEEDQYLNELILVEPQLKVFKNHRDKYSDVVLTQKIPPSKQTCLINNNLEQLLQLSPDIILMLAQELCALEQSNAFIYLNNTTLKRMLDAVNMPTFMSRADIINLIYNEDITDRHLLCDLYHPNHNHIETIIHTLTFLFKYIPECKKKSYILRFYFYHGAPSLKTLFPQNGLPHALLTANLLIISILPQSRKIISTIASLCLYAITPRLIHLLQFIKNVLILEKMLEIPQFKTILARNIINGRQLVQIITHDKQLLIQKIIAQLNTYSDLIQTETLNTFLYHNELDEILEVIKDIKRLYPTEKQVIILSFIALLPYRTVNEACFALNINRTKSQCSVYSTPFLARQLLCPLSKITDDDEILSQQSFQY